MRDAGELRTEPVALLALWRARRGTSIIEFAILAPLFFTLVLAVMELGLYFGNRALIDHAVQSGARVVRVGYVDGVRTDQTSFESALCDGLVLMECGDLSYSVRAFTTLTPGSLDTTLNADGTLQDTTFNLGSPSDAVVVTAAYTHNFVTPLGARFLTGGGAGTSFPIVAHVVVKNEPFPEP